jgi:hypothetical protein
MATRSPWANGWAGTEGCPFLPASGQLPTWIVPCMKVWMLQW